MCYLSTTMPITRSAAKRVRADRKRHLWNLEIKSELKTLTRNFLKSIKEGGADKARSALGTLLKRLDQAASKKTIHRNTASRLKSRLSRRFSKLTKSAS
ncbi:MAG: 30S ribosomal protein S20 [Candidatus Omnitrophica bacterium]|nr:30S ribosomal protein S20 [Candidatus Omnitrophota bacterium]